jgi:uncharacterized low-complexity protein
MTKMENKTKSILTSTLIAGALFAATSSNANPFHYNTLGTGEDIRANLLSRKGSAKNLELKCGEKSKTDSTSTAKKGKDGKCGEGKCGEKKGKGINGSTGKAKKKGN